MRSMTDCSPSRWPNGLRPSHQPCCCAFFASECRGQDEQERARLVAAIEQAAEEILITDIDGNIQYCNPSFEQGTGYSRSESLGRNPRFLKSGQYDAEFYRSLWSTIKGGSIWTGRIANRKKNGSLYETDGTISPLHDTAGKLIGFVSARHDVTDQLRLESQLRQAQKMPSIGRLAGGVPHDFNNLLTVIIGYGWTLHELFSAEDSRLGYINEIRKAGERAGSLTQRLLAFSRQQIIRPTPIDLHRVIRDMEQMLQRLVGENIGLIAVLAPSLALVLADADQMNQVLMNLAANSRDAMPTGGRLTLRTAKIELPAAISGDDRKLAGPVVLLAVSDTGVGMDETTRQHIFEPFFTTEALGRGTGLGLGHSLWHFAAEWGLA
jgi:two-component system cell cycle sensor histidine kinase/response regulator CckA